MPSPRVLTETDLAPHGRDDAGSPLAPYGLNLDGTPRKSNRGARPGQRQGGGRRSGSRRPSPASSIPSASTSSLTDVERKGMLCELVDLYLVAPLAAASAVPIVANYIGPRQADALAGDALILNHFAPNISDGLILMSKTKPKTLAWLDKAEENAPVLLLTSAILQAGKAFLLNHLSPDPRMAQAGRSLAQMKMQEYAMRINEEAAETAARMAMTEPTAQYPQSAAA